MKPKPYYYAIASHSKRCPMQRRTFLMASGSLLVAGSHSANAERAADWMWQTGPQMPIQTQELYPAVHQGRLYVAGGIAAKLGVPYFSQQSFSLSDNEDGKLEWREEATLPEALHHAALVSDQQQLLMVGGFNGGYTHVWRMRANCYRLDDDGWRANGELPVPQAEGVLSCATDNAIHLVTGQSPRGEANSKRSDHREVTTHLRLESGTQHWETAAPIPTARNSATGGWLGDQLVVAGGRTAQGNLVSNEIYDANEDRWRDAAPMPLPQAGTASVVLEDGLIVFGGEIFVPEAGVFPNVWHYSLATDAWTALPDMPTPRHGIGAGLLGNKIAVIGGATEPGGKGTSDVTEILRRE